MELKIIGKIELPKEKEVEDVYRVFLLFSKSLKERYGLEINKKEYLKLCKETFETLDERTGNNVKVKVVFKGEEILALRKKGEKNAFNNSTS